jgi:hypothetical protein
MHVPTVDTVGFGSESRQDRISQKAAASGHGGPGTSATAQKVLPPLSSPGDFVRPSVANAQRIQPAV